VRILLVHQNFPGQFLHLAPALAAAGHEVLGLTQASNQRKAPVRVARYRVPEGVAITGPVKTFADAVERGAIVARAADQLRQQGFAPDVVFGHTGWGETLFLREVFPQARHLAYAEFLYRTTGQDTDFDPEFRNLGLNNRIAVTVRSAYHIQAITQADAGVAPTAYQASTFLPELRAKLSVIHDGIDTDRLRPDPGAAVTLPDGRVLRPGDEVLSFVNRQLEPYRGYHVLMRALPEVLAARPEAQVVIVGGDGASYGPRPPEGQTWKQRFLDEVAGSLDLTRVHFLGQVPYETFVALMQVTRVHAYLTYPFVLSWSMLEAMSAGALVVGSRTPPVSEVIEDGVNGRLVGFFDVPGWSRALIAALADPRADDGLRLAARQTIRDRYDLKSRCLPAMLRFVTGQ
jgi:glycosyltransferase involved in cell wall biosynthesis